MKKEKLHYRITSILLCMGMILMMFQLRGQPDVKLHIEGSAQFDKIGPALGRLILNTQSQNDPGRYGILFSNNTLAPFLGDDIGDQFYGFYSEWNFERTYDAAIRIHGKASNSWGKYLELTHNGTDGYIQTDDGNLILYPEDGNASVGVGTTNPGAKLEASIISSGAESKTGLKGTAVGNGLLYGVYGYASGYSASTSSQNAYGVYGYVDSGNKDKYGVFGWADHNSGTKYGVYGKATGSGTNYAGYFEGDVYSTGNYLPSDLKLKTNFSTTFSSLDKINQIQVKTYKYKIEEFPELQLPKSIQTGIIAQEIEKVFPELVKDMKSPESENQSIENHHFKSVNYQGLIPHLVKAIQEQQKQIDQLIRANRILESKLKGL